MSDTLLAAVVAGLIAITVAYMTQFVSEAYKRHRDGSAVAAAIAGELSSYRPAWEILCQQVQTWRGLVNAGERETIHFRPFDRPTDLFIGEMVGKLGLLGAESVEKIVFIYGNIRGFRNSLEVILRDHSSMDDDELIGRCTSCIIALDSAHKEGVPLIRALKARSTARFLYSRSKGLPSQKEASE